MNAAGIGPARNNLSQVEVHILQDMQELPGERSFEGEQNAGTEKGKGLL